MKLLLMIVAAVCVQSMAFADPTVGDKVKEDTNTATRSVKKGVDHVQEGVCAQSDAKCLAMKGKHRIKEGGDYVKDKVDESKTSH